MRKTYLSVVFLMLFSITNLAIADNYQNTIDTFKKAPQTHPYFKSAYGYAIFPTVGKGGMVIGGAYGKGQVYRGGVVTGKTSIAQLTIGFQLGGQAYSEIIFFKDKRAYDKFTSGGFAFAVQASAVAITIGAQAQVGTKGISAGAGDKQSKAKYVKGMTVFTHAKGGAMYEATIGGQKFTFKPINRKK